MIVEKTQAGHSCREMLPHHRTYLEISHVILYFELRARHDAGQDINRLPIDAAFEQSTMWSC
jgi:hypothetical protein